MIPESETRRLAAVQGVDLLTVDLDYALGWLLAGLFLEPEIRDNWVFKGGTSLRKCWFPEYRFSEDLDFTVIGSLELEDVKNLLGGPGEVASRRRTAAFCHCPRCFRYQSSFDNGSRH